MTKKRTANSCLAIWRAKCFEDNLVFKVKIVLSTSILLETPPHRKAAKRYLQHPQSNSPK